MRTLKLVLFVIAAGLFTNSNAQTVEEILTNYYENTGGIENWQNLQGVKMYAKVNQGGMEIPLEIVQLKSGKQMTSITFQGKSIKQGVFNGEILWNTNFSTQKAEKSNEEATDNMKIQSKDFPDAFLNYKEKGYTAELLGKEDFKGTETFKIKLIKTPITVDGIEEENVSFYFVDTENFVPLAVQSEIKTGPMKGQMQEITMSDYQEVDGLYFPYSLTQGLKGQSSQAITLDKIELNPIVDDAEFEFPEVIEEAVIGKE